MAQSEPAAAPEEARRRWCRQRQTDRRGEAAAPGPEGLRSSSSGSTSPPRRQRAEAAAAAAGERVRERASRVGEGRRPRRQAKARGERPRPPRARALAAPSSRGRPRSPASPPPFSRLLSRACSYFPPPPPWQRRAPPTALGLARVLCEEEGARDSVSRLPEACDRGGLPAAVLSDIFSAGRGLRRRRFCPRILSPSPLPLLAYPSLLATCGPVLSHRDCGAPRSPLPHPSRPKIGLGRSANAEKALN